MKKRLCICLSCLLLIVLAGCSQGEAKAPQSSTDPTAEATPTPIPTPTPHSALPRDAQGVVMGSYTLTEPVLLMANGNGVNVRATPSLDAEIVTRVTLGQKVESSQIEDGWYIITMYPGMQTGYVRSDLLVDYDETRTFYVKDRRDTVEVLNETTGEMEEKQSHLVDVRKYLPNIEYHMIFATPENFGGKVLYEYDACVLQKGTAEKLVKAQEMFAKDGYTIKIYDAYRPSFVSGYLSGLVKNERYVAAKGKSIHNRAAAVDMTLVDADGNELEMPTPMHTLNETANRNYEGMSETARENMEYMASVMKKCGFITIQSEWWHFSDASASKYPPLDIEIWRLIREEATE
ncbi:SH3 domain-containing protein [Eubacteriales bacterium OttesenSCG-928-N14]|nr:SH3 domain-containing protein [Eubacteriales bacterium OttesenSCG-928-N14]